MLWPQENEIAYIMLCSPGKIWLLVLPAVFMLFKMKLSISYNSEVLLEVRTGIHI